jgi:HEAT repeat protein
MRVIEVEVDSDIFSQVEFEILVNEEDRNFFQKNLEELKFIDQQKQLDAVKRLTYSKEISLRSDIAKQLGILLSLDSFEHHADVVQALVKWDRMDKENAAEMVLSRARKLAVNGNLIPESYLNYVLEHKLVNAGDVLLYCWIKDPILHEPSLVRAGKVAEKGLIELLPNLDNIELKSAINVLGKIGTVDALPSLLVAYKEANEDLKKSLKATIDAIKSRE